MTSILLGVLCLALLFGGVLRIIRGAIQASNRTLEAQRQQLARETEITEAAPAAPEPERPHIKQQQATHQAAQPANVRNIPMEQIINHRKEVEVMKDFDLREAVIASEILRPKFEE